MRSVFLFDHRVGTPELFIPSLIRNTDRHVGVERGVRSVRADSIYVHFLAWTIESKKKKYPTK